MKTLRLGLIERIVRMMSAVGTGGAWEGRDGTTRVDYGGLTLGRVAYPYVDVVGAVSLVEGA